MHVLMVAMQYPTGAGESYLTTELADALVADGHGVEVLHLDWHAPPGATIEEFIAASGVRVVRCPARAVSGLGEVVHGASKFILSGWRVARVAAERFDLSSFDLVICWMPALGISPLVRKIVAAGIPNRLLFVWDFFPDHHHEIGRISGGLPLRIARAWEQALLGSFTAIVCTLPGNAEYLRRRFRVGPEQRVLVTPIWGDATAAATADRTEVRRRHSLPIDRPIVVFGGQLVEGRGFEQMLAAADAAMIAGSDLNFLFVGEGRLAPMIAARAAKQANILFRPSLARADYVDLLTACDVGMVVTVPGVTSFSIPSKTIDYLRAGLPIIAAVEHGSDYVRIIERYGVGSAVPFGEPSLFFQQADRLAKRGKISEAAARCLQEVFDVRHAVATVLDAATVTRKLRARSPQEPSVQTLRRKRSAVP
jgi:glycosyltransferase involved in cell wall biosynthesis